MADVITIRCRENGPLLVQLPVKIVDHLGNEFTVPPGKDNIALCRCGQSKNKPFCDGSHKTCSFMAAEIAGMPHQETTVDDHGKTVRFEGVPLKLVLEKAGVTFGETL